MTDEHTEGLLPRLPRRTAMSLADELDICPQCEGSGVGVADTTCTRCSGTGGALRTPETPGDDGLVERLRGHTPGPWCMVRRVGEDTEIWAQNAADDLVALVSDGETELANARLIAAAPELLVALDRAREWIVHDDTPMGPKETALHRHLLAQIEAAIARATGAA